MNTTAQLPAFPPPEDGDSEQVALYLETGHALWANGDGAEAARWLRRAVEAAEEDGNDMRSLQLARAAADIRASIGTSLPPPLPSAPSPVVSNESRDRSHSGVAPVPPGLPELPDAPIPGSPLAGSRSAPPPKPSMRPAPPTESIAGGAQVQNRALASRPPPPPSARASMPPAPSARASMSPQAPAATPSPPTAASHPSARPTAPSNRASVAPSKPSPSTPPPKPSVASPAVVASAAVPAARTLPSGPSGFDDLAGSSQLQSLLAQGRAVRVSVKRSARDDTLYVVRKLTVGKPVPTGAREAILVLPEADPEF